MKNHQSVVASLVEACRQRDRKLLSRILRAGARGLVDSGGRVAVPEHAARGRAEVADLLFDVVSMRPGIEVTVHDVNGSPGIVMRADGTVVGVVSVAVQHGAVSDVWIVVNPDKLRHWNGSD